MKEGSPYSDRYDTYRVYRSPLSIRPKVPLMTWDEKAARPRILFAKFGDPDVVGYELSFTEQDSGATADTTVAATSLYLDWLPGGLWDVCSRAVYEDDSTSGYSDTMAVTIVVNSAGETASNGIPGSFVVQAYPNPFNSSVRISVESAGARLLGLNLYNELGRLVKTIPLDVAGSQGRILTLDMKGYASGPYFLRAVRSDGSVVTRRIVLLR